MPRKQNVSGISAIHHPLGDIDPGSGNVCALIHIGNLVHRPTVNAHPNLQARIVFERAADLYRTLRRFLRALVKHQRHAVAGGDL